MGYCCLPGTIKVNYLSFLVMKFPILTLQFASCSLDLICWVCSTLFDAGQKAEAAKYLRLVVVHKPAYKRFLDQCEQDDDIASDLTGRRDY